MECGLSYRKPDLERPRDTLLALQATLLSERATLFSSQATLRNLVFYKQGWCLALDTALTGPCSFLGRTSSEKITAAPWHEKPH